MVYKKSIKVNAKHDLGNLTLAAKHTEIADFYKNHAEQLPELNNKLKNFQTKQAKLQKKSAFEQTEKERIQLFQLDLQINELTNSINSLNTNQDGNNYYLDVMEHLENYYSPDGGHEDRAEIYELYLKKLDPSYTPKVKKSDTIYWCKECNKERELNSLEGIIVCIDCGLTEHVIIEDNKQSYSDGMIPQESNYFNYKKITHFRECIEQCQGKERTDISDEIFKRILEKLKEEGISSTNMHRINNKKMKEVLRELGLNRYYEHIPFILTKLGGKGPPTIPAHIEARLEKMFKQIQIAFKKCCPENRKNFPSYNYVLHKCVELIGTCDELLTNFPLLKSKQKLQNMDQIWYNICNITGYEFIPSI